MWPFLACSCEVEQIFASGGVGCFEDLSVDEKWWIQVIEAKLTADRDELVLGSNWQSKSFSAVYGFPRFNMIFQNCHADYCSLSPSLEISLLLAYLYRKIISSGPIDGSQLWYSISMRFPVVKGRRILLFSLLLLEFLSFPKDYVQYMKKIRMNVIKYILWSWNTF